jgi:hypothetical protein
MHRPVEKAPAPSCCIPAECIPSMLSRCAAKRESKFIEGCIPDGMQRMVMCGSTKRCIPPGCNTDTERCTPPPPEHGRYARRRSASSLRSSDDDCFCHFLLFFCLQDIVPANDRPTKKAPAKWHPGGMPRPVEKPPAPPPVAFRRNASRPWFVDALQNGRARSSKDAFLSECKGWRWAVLPSEASLRDAIRTRNAPRRVPDCFVPVNDRPAKKPRQRCIPPGCHFAKVITKR